MRLRCAPPQCLPSLLADCVPHRPCATQLVAHMATNKIILKRWEEGNVREWSAITYPNQAGGRLWADAVGS